MTPRSLITLAAKALDTDRRGLARYLGLPVSTLRSWEVRGVPTYARLALAAIVSGLDPEGIVYGASEAGKLCHEEVGPIHE
jgi:hypothetical protein